MKLLSVNEVGIRLSHSPQTVRNLISRGILECFRCPGIRISEDQLAEYLANSKPRRESRSATATRKLQPQAIRELNANRLKEAWRKQGVE